MKWGHKSEGKRPGLAFYCDSAGLPGASAATDLLVILTVAWFKAC